MTTFTAEPFIDVLVIEDDEDIRVTTLEFFEMEAVRARGFENGQLALQFLQTRPDPLPKLILVDLHMPVMDGPSFRQAQLSDARLAQVPCVVMSADGRLPETCRELKIAENIKKPVDLDVLLELVTKYVSGPRPKGLS